MISWLKWLIYIGRTGWKRRKDHTIMPFGRLVKEKLETGLNILFDIRDLMIAYYEGKQPASAIIGKYNIESS